MPQIEKNFLYSRGDMDIKAVDPPKPEWGNPHIKKIKS
jgi:hypothetical protein